jgi:hypothetical protein
MNETSNSWLSASGTSTLGYSGTSINTGNSGITLSGNSTINTFSALTYQNMRPQQVKVAVFTITRDEDTNEINSTKFIKELWIERKNGTSIDLIVAKQLDVDFDPETTVIKEITSISF